MDIREISISRTTDNKSWDVWVSDGNQINSLRSKGWEEVDASGPYVKFELPLKAISIRKKSTVELYKRQSVEMYANYIHAFGGE